MVRLIFIWQMSLQCKTTQKRTLRYVYAQYSQGVYVKDIIQQLNKKGIFYNGKPFARNTLYNMLKNEKYCYFLV